MAQHAYNLQTMDFSFIKKTKKKQSGITLMYFFKKKKNSSRIKFMNAINIWP